MTGRLWSLRYAGRRLALKPAFSLTAVLTLALGSGVTVAIFSLLYGVLLRPLPYPQGSRLVAVSERQDGGEEASPLAPAEVRSLQTRGSGLSAVVACKYWLVDLSGVDQPEMLLVLQTTSDLLDVLEVEPFLGRGFEPSDDEPNSEPVVLLSHELWRRTFGAEPSILGRRVLLGGTHHTVIGVMPPGFQFPLREDLPGQRVSAWLPLRMSAEEWRDSSDHSLGIVARLAPGVSLSQARGKVAEVARRFEEVRGESGPVHEIELIPLREELTGDLRPAFAVLFGGGLCVFLICCANVGNLMLAHAVGREKQTGIKLALGARRTVLVREWMAEGLLLALGGGTLGLVFAHWGLNLFRWINPIRLPRIDDIGIGAPAVLFTLGVAGIAVLASGLVAGLLIRGADLHASVHEGSRWILGAGGRRRGGRNSLIVLQVAASTVLAVIAALLIASFLSLQAVDLGFEPDRVLTAWTMLSEPRFPTAEQRTSFFRGLFENLEALPGVGAAGGVSNLPLTNSSSASGLRLADGSQEDRDRRWTAELRVATAGYFRALEIGQVKGRAFDSSAPARGLRVAVIDETLARQLSHFGDPIGQRISLDAAPGEPWEVIGVVRSTRHSEVAASPSPTVYVPYSQMPVPFLILTVRATGEPAALTALLRRSVQDLDPGQPLFNVQTMNEIVAQATAEPRLRSFLLGLFACLSLVLAIVGVYGVVSYTLAERARELAVRMALGADAGSIKRMMLWSGMRLAATGVVLGLLAAAALMRFVSSLLFGVGAGEPLIFVGVALFLVIAALAACYVPARRATRIAPARALQTSA